jgi:ribosomal protein S18 acetylase RimI-like enzyme
VAVRPLPDGSDVVELRAEDVPRAARVLAAAFADDPVARWCFPDRRGTLERAFALFMRRVWLPHRQCFTTDRGVGAACWLPPEHWHVPWSRQLALAPALVTIVRGRMSRFLAFLALLESSHPRPRHWYLPLLGVDPDWQGRGFGSQLMRPVLERCDAERTPAYLEASTPRNRALYERHGFEVTRELRLPMGGPPMWPMWREPR